MNDINKTNFAPELFIKPGVSDLSFYEKAFSAVEVMRFSNDDGGVHVAEFVIGNAIFHVHEDKISGGNLNPETIKGTTIRIGLFVDDVDEVMKQAIDAGGILISPAQSYDYGYRQGEIKDPFGHVWQIQKKI